MELIRQIIQIWIHEIIRFYKQLQLVCSNNLLHCNSFLANLLENDDNLSYFPAINNPNHSSRSQQIFLNGSNNTGLFNDILSNNNPISTLSTNTFLNNRQQQQQQQPYKPLSAIPFPPQQQTRNDENVFHNNHPHPSSVRMKNFREWNFFSFWFCFSLMRMIIP